MTQPDQNLPPDEDPAQDGIEANAPVAAPAVGEPEAALSPEEIAEAEEAAAAKRTQRAALFIAVASVALVIAYANGMGLPGLALIVLGLALIAWLIG